MWYVFYNYTTPSSQAQAPKLLEFAFCKKNHEQALEGVTARSGMYTCKPTIIILNDFHVSDNVHQYY